MKKKNKRGEELRSHEYLGQHLHYVKLVTKDIQQIVHGFYIEIICQWKTKFTCISTTTSLRP